ncbi:DUF4328 domain-containing protein [Kitasatospora griseola]|uniref:DUF4328 domain-containing protein n=1 Tax=Kitasatospora griseola TaxID=2064 RepID=UPI00342FD6EE
MTSTAGTFRWGLAVHSESAYDQPQPQVLPEHGSLAGFRRLAVAAQTAIGVQTAWSLVLGATGGTRSTLFSVSLLLVPVLFFAPVVLFILWFRRCRLNVDRFGPGLQKYSAGWTIGAWFIPLAMWWIPRRIALDIWRITAPTASAWLINAWWAAWLAKTLGSLWISRISGNATGYSLFDMAAGLAAGALAILMIQQVTSHQEARLRATAQPVPPAPPAPAPHA